MPTRKVVHNPSAKRTPMRRNPVQISIRNLDTIYPYTRNPRDNQDAVESVKNSIEQFGFLVPIIIDSSGSIVAGHTRYLAARRLKLVEAPCIIADHLTPEQIKAFRLIDNKVSELAKWDLDLLSAEISALTESGIQFTEFGWTQEEIDCFSDVVADDCMGAGVAAGLDVAGRPSDSTGDQRGPNRTRLVIGEFVIFIPQDVYRRWAGEIRAGCDYVESAIERELKDRLQITPYEQAQ